MAFCALLSSTDKLDFSNDKFDQIIILDKRRRQTSPYEIASVCRERCDCGRSWNSVSLRRRSVSDWTSVLDSCRRKLVRNPARGLHWRRDWRRLNAQWLNYLKTGGGALNSGVHVVLVCQCDRDNYVDIRWYNAVRMSRSAKYTRP